MRLFCALSGWYYMFRTARLQLLYVCIPNALDCPIHWLRSWWTAVRRTEDFSCLLVVQRRSGSTDSHSLHGLHSHHTFHKDYVSGHESTPVCAGNRQAAIKPRMPVTRSRQFWKTCCLIWQCLVKLFIGNTVCIASPCVSLLVAWHATTSIDFEQWFPLITLWCDIVLTEKWVEGTTTSCSVPLAHYSLHYIHCSEVYCCSL